jgi:hypothetical protein
MSKRLISWTRSSASMILARTLDMIYSLISMANKKRVVSEEEQSKLWNHARLSILSVLEFTM